MDRLHFISSHLASQGKSVRILKSLLGSRRWGAVVVIGLLTVGCQNDLGLLFEDIPIQKEPEPTLTTVPASGETLDSFSQIELTYSHLMSGVTFLENYVLSGEGQGTLSVEAIQDLGANRYLLTLDGFPKTGTLQLRVDNVVDADIRPLSNPTAFWTLEIPGPEVTASPATESSLNSLATVDLEYSVAMQGADQASNYILANAAGGNLAIANLEVIDAANSQYRLNLSGLPGDGTTTITINATNVTDLSGNQLENNVLRYFTDVTNPTITGTNPTDGSVASSASSVRVTFSEAVTGASNAANWSLTGAAAAGLSVTQVNALSSPENSWRVFFNTNASDGDLTVTAVNIFDEVGNPLDDNSFMFTIDSVQPTISSAVPTEGTTFNAISQVDVTFTRSVTGAMNTANYNVAGGGSGSLNVTNVTDLGGDTYRLTLGGSVGNGAVRIQISNVTDAVNGLALSDDQLDYTGDTNQPTASFNPAGGISGAISQFEVTYNEAVTGATTPGNYGLSGTALGTLAVNTIDDLGGNVYRVNLSGAPVDGNLTVTISGVGDAAGNALSYTPPVYTIDAVAPTVTGTNPADGTNLNSLTTIQVDYSEPMSGALTTGNYILGGAGAASLSVSMVSDLGGNSYQLTIGGSLSDGPITLNFSGITDTSGNALTPFTLNLTGDFSGPTATGNPADGGFVNALTALVITYSEAVTGGDTLGNYSLSGVGAAGLSLDSVTDIGGNQYQANISGAVANGAITLNLDTSGGIEDGFGNDLVTATISLTGDIDDPSFTPSLGGGSLINTLASVDIQYDEPMLNATANGNYTLSGAGVGSLSVTSITDLGSDNYRVNISGTPGDGTVTLTLDGLGTLTDRAGNSLTGTTVSWTADTTAPTKTITPDAQAAVGPAITYMDISYSETMAAGVTTAGNYTLGGAGQGTLSVDSVSSLGGNDYRLNFTGTQNVNGGPLTLTISGITDPTGNALSGTTHRVIAGPTKYRILTFNNAGIGQNLDNFPVLLRLDASRIDYPGMQAGGIDIRFYDSDGSTELRHEIEYWNTGGESAVWVRVPRVNSGSTTDSIYMYYTGSALPDSQNPGGLWTASYRAVYHFNDDPSGGVITDSTSSGNHGTPVNMDAGNIVAGNASGLALSLNGTDEYITVGDDATLQFSPGTNVTFESVFYWNGTATGFTPIVEKGNLDFDNYSVFMSGAGTARMTFEFTDSIGGGNFRSVIEGPLSYSDTNWISTALVHSDTGNTVGFYKNAVQTDSLAQSNSLRSGITDPMWIGRIKKVGIDHYLDGTLDELRISAITRSVQWLTAQERYYNDTYVTYGAEN